MLNIGITGGIGSGKSVVSQIFGVLGIPVLDADAFAKQLMAHNDDVKTALIAAFGSGMYEDGQLNRPYLAGIVFNDRAQLAILNSIVHPAVRKYGKQWMAAQQSPYVLKEAALFFESGSDADMDYMIGVQSPFDARLQRAMQRDHADETAIRKRMEQQMDETKKMSLCDFVIRNDESVSLIEQVLHLHKKFTQVAK
ncbi:dephospho-CoA kinase [Taibaiella sp. KBW10]|uniref:dephospho-CoA kinase n=1 Tax=Taibaiella sp. KBW10 TaxID=2153357 RepID=UPI000F5A3291|nr:dephospho-CoA kinase [Taibaiella sp. KBW10]RQO32459.1 dephospho-CoA kinase [Taibaiella sp. KBW10]